MAIESVNKTTTTINTRMMQKKDAAANWEAHNPVILNGEIIFVETASGEVKTKIGDGVSKYKDLPFVTNLPKVSAQDDNKFLRVRNGRWVAEVVPFSVVYTGDSEPTDQLGNDGDLYMQIDSF